MSITSKSALSTIAEVAAACAADQHGTVQLTEDQFDEIFDHVPSAADPGSFYMNYEEAAAFPNERVWTAVDGDGVDDSSEAIYLLPGFHRVNSFAHVVSVQPWPADNIEVVLDSSDSIDENDPA